MEASLTAASTATSENCRWLCIACMFSDVSRRVQAFRLHTRCWPGHQGNFMHSLRLGLADTFFCRVGTKVSSSEQSIPSFVTCRVHQVVACALARSASSRSRRLSAVSILKPVRVECAEHPVDGDRGAGGIIPGGAWLVFEVEVGL